MTTLISTFVVFGILLVLFRQGASSSMVEKERPYSEILFQTSKPPGLALFAWFIHTQNENSRLQHAMFENFQGACHLSEHPPLGCPSSSIDYTQAIPVFNSVKTNLTESEYLLGHCTCQFEPERLPGQIQELFSRRGESIFIEDEQNQDINPKVVHFLYDLWEEARREQISRLTSSEEIPPFEIPHFLSSLLPFYSFHFHLHNGQTVSIEVTSDYELEATSIKHLLSAPLFLSDEWDSETKRNRLRFKKKSL